MFINRKQLENLLFEIYMRSGDRNLSKRSLKLRLAGTQNDTISGFLDNLST